MPDGSTAADSVLVGIVREFLLAHQTLGRLVARWDSGRLNFADIQEFVGDDESSVLFRLKEHCHALFRLPGPGVAPVRTGELFDLAVGSLFHEAMKLRENVYQREVYVPRVEQLRRESTGEADSILRDFEKILGGAAMRLAESFEETRSLLGLARQQLGQLLADNCENGLVARFLVENEERVCEVFSETFDSILERVYGSPGRAFRLATHSYLASAYFEEARDLLVRAPQDPAAARNVEGLRDYASGMDAFLRGDYDASLGFLESWVNHVSPETERAYLELAGSAVARLPNIADTQGDAPIVARGRRLEEQIESILSASGDEGSPPRAV